VVDAGNALFMNMGAPQAKEKERATFILQTMGKLGTRVMTVGIRDLPAGVGFLQDAAKKAGVAVVSANLKAGAKAPFPATAVIDVDGIKVGFIGLSQPGPVPGVQGLMGEPSLPAVREALKRLPADVQLKVLLAATPFSEAMAVAGELKGQIDLVLHSGGSVPPNLQPVNHNYIATSGERGRQLVHLTLKVDGKGDFENLDEATRSKELLTRAETNLAQLAERRKAADGEWAKSQLDTTIAELTARRDALKAQVNKATGKDARTISSTTVNLGAELGDDPELLKRQLELEPPGAAGKDRH
jgi:2',3'-cyclic-nucleotide 2'-phosphodiesterase (5'-nucleotidase family)